MDADLKLIILMMIGLVLVSGPMFCSLIITSENITITSHVEKIVYEKDWMVLYLIDGRNYNVMYGSDTILDFDESKNVTIKLHYDNLLWITNTNDCWSISSIIKY